MEGERKELFTGGNRGNRGGNRSSFSVISVTSCRNRDSFPNETSQTRKYLTGGNRGNRGGNIRPFSVTSVSSCKNQSPCFFRFASGSISRLIPSVTFISRKLMSNPIGTSSNFI